MTVLDFEAHVERAVASLPADLRAAMSNVEIVVEDEHPDDPDVLEDEIRITVLHEIAHHFGLDEDRLTDLGWG